MYVQQASVLSGFWLVVNSGEWKQNIRGERRVTLRYLFLQLPLCEDSEPKMSPPRPPSLTNLLFPSSYNHCLLCSFGIWNTQDVPLFLVFPHTPTSKNSPFVNKFSLNIPHFGTPLFFVGVRTDTVQITYKCITLVEVSLLNPVFYI